MVSRRRRKNPKKARPFSLRARFARQDSWCEFLRGAKVGKRMVVVISFGVKKGQDMLHDIAVFQVAGRPLIFYLGIVTLISLVVTALIGFARRRGIRRIPFRWHRLMAIATLVMAGAHAVLALSTYL